MKYRTNRRHVRKFAVSGFMALLVSWVGFADPAHACRCKNLQPYQHIQKYDVIATVVVTETRLVKRSSARRNGVALMNVKHMWKGPKAKKLKVHYDGNFGLSPTSSCSFEFPHAQEFFLFATVKGDTLFTTQCAIAPARGFDGKDKYQAALEAFEANGRKIKRVPKFVTE